MNCQHADVQGFAESADGRRIAHSDHVIAPAVWAGNAEHTLARHLNTPILVLIEMSSAKKLVVIVRRMALIVEGDPRLQRVMSRHLGRMGFHALSASHYDGAVRHLATGEPDIAYIDVRLPSKSGYELCEYIRRALGLESLPIILTSEYGSPGDMAHAEDAGGNAFLHKPFSMPQLTHCIESLVDPIRWRAPLRHELQPLASKRGPPDSWETEEDRKPSAA